MDTRISRQRWVYLQARPSCFARFVLLRLASTEA